MRFLFSEEAVSAQGGFGFSLSAAYLQTCKRAALWNSVALFQSASATEGTWLHRKPAKYDCLVSPPNIHYSSRAAHVQSCRDVWGGSGSQDMDDFSVILRQSWTTTELVGRNTP